jgi:hypothetical protein
MWLVGAVSALVLAGLWLCWSRRPRRLAHPAGSAADAAYRRHPAGRARQAYGDDWASPDGAPPPAEWSVPRGPDDDPEFLQELDRVIRGNQDPDLD